MMGNPKQFSWTQRAWLPLVVLPWQTWSVFFWWAAAGDGGRRQAERLNPGFDDKSLTDKIEDGALTELHSLRTT